MGKLTDLCALKNLHDRDRIGYWCDSSPIMHGHQAALGCAVLHTTVQYCAALCKLHSTAVVLHCIVPHCTVLHHAGHVLRNAALSFELYDSGICFA